MTASEIALERVDLREYWRVVVRGRWIILATTVLVVGAALFWTYMQPSVYEASLRLAVVPRDPSALLGGVDDDTAKGDISTELTILGSERIRAAVAEQIGHAPDVTFADAGSNVIAVTGQAGSGERALADAQAYVDVYIEQRRADAAGVLQAKKASVEGQISDLQLRLADPTLPSNVITSTQTQIFNLQTELSNLDAALASPNPGAALI